jgi:integrase
MQVEYRDPKTPGLSLIVGKRAKTWSLTYATSTGRRRTTLGRYPGISLADARREAEAKRVAARQGVDHQKEKRDYKAARTVAEIAEEYLEKAASQHSTYRCYRAVVRNDLIPILGSMKMVDVRRADINRVIDRSLGEGKLYMANRVYRTLQVLFKWAVSRGEIDHNPCLGVRPPAKDRARDRALTDDELKRIWQEGLPKLSFQGASAIKILLLTGQRLQEVVGAKWPEIDFDRAVWTLPTNEPGRSKKRKSAHLVPLSDPVLSILAALNEHNGSLPTIFRPRARRKHAPVTPTRNLVSGSKAQLDAALADLKPWRTHDLRRTCRTGMGMLGVPVHVAELVLGHALSGIVATYDRHSYLAEKRDALNRWAAHVLQVVGETPQPSAEVVTLRA